MVQTRFQRKANMETNIYLSNDEFREMNKSIMNTNKKIDTLQSVLEYQNMEMLKIKSFLSFLLFLGLIYICFSLFFDENMNIIIPKISYYFEDFSTYHSYIFNSTFSEEWLNQFMEKNQCNNQDIDFYIMIGENQTNVN
jgi:hypothetical protein